MSALTNADTLLTLHSDGEADRTFHGPIAVSRNPASTTGTDSAIKEIWASDLADKDQAHAAAKSLAAGVHGPQVVQMLGSSHSGLAARLTLVGGQTIQLTRTTMKTVDNSGTPPLVAHIEAWK